MRSPVKRPALVENKRDVLKHWSTRIAALGAVLSSLFTAWPGIALSIWNQMPDEVKTYLPQQIVTVVPAGLFAAVIAVKFFKQEGVSDGNG